MGLLTQLMEIAYDGEATWTRWKSRFVFYEKGIEDLEEDEDEENEECGVECVHLLLLFWQRKLKKEKKRLEVFLCC